MQFYLFGGINGSLLGRKEYQGRTNWIFPRREQIGSSSGQFWLSSYGQEVYYQLQEAAQDIVAELGCAPAPTRIIGQHERGPHIHLGRRNGVKLGGSVPHPAQRRLRRSLWQVTHDAQPGH